MDTVRIFDTTLRDGEQAPGFSMNTGEKLRLALQLENLGVDVIEAGFPIASQGDFAAVKAVATEVRASTVAGLARATQPDIEAVLRAVEPAAKPRVHVFLATSDLHLKHKLRITRSEALDAIGKMVSFASQRCPDVEFSAEDASRSDREFLAQVFAIAADAGAKVLNAPDTVGYATPQEYGEMFVDLRARLGNRPGLVWSAHCHMIWAWRSPIRWLPWLGGRVKLNAPLTASASAPAMPPWKKLPWPSRCGAITIRRRRSFA